jgi:hypothetical protein
MKKLSYRIILTFLLILSINILLTKVSYCQVNQEWIRRYNNPSNTRDESGGITLDKLGNVYVSGNSFYSSTTDIVTIKYSPSGSQQWTAIYPLNTSSHVKRVVTDMSDNIYVCSEVGNDFTGLYDIFLIKYNSAGVMLWLRDFGDGHAHGFYPYDLIIDRTGNIYEVGGTDAYGVGAFVVKYTPNGDTLWTRTYRPSGYNGSHVESAAIDSSNNLIIAGSCIIGSGFASDCLIIKYNSSGDMLWSNVYNSGGYNTMDFWLKTGIGSNDDIFVTGMGGLTGDYVTIRYNSSGIQQWIQRYRGPVSGNSANAATGLVVDNQNNIIVTGQSQSSVSVQDFATIKYNANGDSLWVKRYDNPSHGNDEAYSITLDEFGSIYVNGMSIIYGVWKFSTIKYDSNGNQKWIMQYPGAPKFQETSIVVDNLSNVYVVGDSSSGDTQDFITIKYAQLIGVNRQTSKVSEDYILYQNFPNPFNPQTTIKYFLPKASRLTIKIYNLLGYEIETVFEGKQKAGEHEFAFDGTELSSGVYFYSLTTDNYKETKKMILLK